MDSLCRVRNNIMFVLSWLTVSALTLVLFLNNPLGSAETARHDSTYTILYVIHLLQKRRIIMKQPYVLLGQFSIADHNFWICHKYGYCILFGKWFEAEWTHGSEIKFSYSYSQSYSYYVAWSPMVRIYIGLWFMCAKNMYRILNQMEITINIFKSLSSTKNRVCFIILGEHPKLVFMISYFRGWKIGQIWGHYGVIKWKHLPRYWPFVRGIHRSPVNSPHTKATDAVGSKSMKSSIFKPLWL